VRSITNTFRDKLTEIAFPKNYGGTVFRLCLLAGVASSHAADEVLGDAARHERSNQTRIVLSLLARRLGCAERPSVTEARHGMDPGQNVREHRVIVNPFLMDRYPVTETNAQFRKFVAATGHVTIAEIAPDPCDYPGALPDTLPASSLVFVKPNQHCRSATVSVCAAELECPDRR
jgi:hypothetical protein